MTFDRLLESKTDNKWQNNQHLTNNKQRFLNCCLLFTVAKDKLECANDIHSQ